jgi:TetR/AcrR family transcriptional regulator, biofilm operon repressor
MKLQILSAAKTCFEKFGFDKTTLEDIGAEVGLNKASLYYYYKNKQDIFTEALAEEAAQFISSLQKHISKEKNAAKKIKMYIDMRTGYYRHILNINKISKETLQKLLPQFMLQYEDVLQQEIAFIASILQAAVRSGEMKPINTRRLAYSIISVADALKHHAESKALLTSSEPDYKDATHNFDFLMKLVIKSLAIPAKQSATAV